MVCGTSEILLSFYQKKRRTEQVHNDDDHSFVLARTKDLLSFSIIILFQDLKCFVVLVFQSLFSLHQPNYFPTSFYKYCKQKLNVKST
jgi:hypothetical protein